MKAEVDVSDKKVTIYLPKATITVVLDGSGKYLVAVNRNGDRYAGEPTETIPQAFKKLSK